MATAAEGFAPAKINLTLHVTGQRENGYHLLDSLVVFANVGDRLTITPASAMAMDVTGPFADGVPSDARNLAWRAAELCRAPSHIQLEKNLPHGAGIGGGSADAAAVLRHFGNLHDGLDLGADVPVCLSQAPQIMRGIGDELSLAESVPPLEIVLVNPGVEVATPQVFKALAAKENPAMSALPQDPAAFLDWLDAQRNDLQKPAIAIAPQISDALSALSGARVSRMSGSGTTCFGVFHSAIQAQNAARQIAEDHPGWWVVAARSFGADGVR